MKEKFAQSLVTVAGNSKKVIIEYPKDSVSKYVKLYGLDEFIESLPEDLTTFDITNTSSSPLDLTLPQSFRRFTNLETFHASNAFNEIPEVLKGMQNLSFIALPDSPNIHSIPEWIADLPSLLAITFFGGDQNLQIGPKVRAAMDREDEPLNVMYKDGDE